MTTQEAKNYLSELDNGEPLLDKNGTEINLCDLEITGEWAPLHNGIEELDDMGYRTNNKLVFKNY